MSLKLSDTEESVNADLLKSIINQSLLTPAKPHTNDILDGNSLINDLTVLFKKESIQFFNWYMDLPIGQKWAFRVNHIDIEALYNIFKRETTI